MKSPRMKSPETTMIILSFVEDGFIAKGCAIQNH